MSSKRHVRRKKCGQKIRYKSQSAAVSALIRIKNKTGEVMESYRCKYCRKWHIGHRKRRHRYR